MTRTTTNTLDKVRAKLQECRDIIDNHLYYSVDSLSLPQDERLYCRKIYDSICKTMDSL